jgi:hypothetical protein
MAAACVNCETDTSSSVHEGHDMDAMPDNDSMNCDTNIDLCSMVFCVGVSIVSSSFDCLAVNASNDLPRFNSFSLLSLAPTVIYHPPIS